QEYSLYHVYCLFASFGQVKSTTYYVNGDLCSTPFEYRRPSVHKSQMAICFKCWKLVKITEVEPRKEYYSGWGRWVYEVESEDLMKDHWNNSCSSQIKFVRVEQGEWTGVLEKKVKNFENVLKKVLEQVTSEDIERIKKL
ncbi:hypothetical protein RhiirC2_795565, partial [Rhizophagus irregularis]